MVGVEILHEDGRRETVTARAVLLATGGAGMVFANTTNPDVATADGVAIAGRAGAELARWLDELPQGRVHLKPVDIVLLVESLSALIRRAPRA